MARLVKPRRGSLRTHFLSRHRLWHNSRTSAFFRPNCSPCISTHFQLLIAPLIFFVRLST